MGHDVLVIDEVYSFNEKNSRFEVLTTIWHKFTLRTQNTMNFKLCVIIGRVLGFFVVVNPFMQRKNFLNFDKGWAVIV